MEGKKGGNEKQTFDDSTWKKKYMEKNTRVDQGQGRQALGCIRSRGENREMEIRMSFERIFSLMR